MDSPTASGAKALLKRQRSAEESVLMVRLPRLEVGEIQSSELDRTNRKRIRANKFPPSLPTESKHVDYGVSDLPEDVWIRIREMIASAKSLGEITRIMLTFFAEHEAIHRRFYKSKPLFPIAIPANEIYNMLVPRKRRIYDVLHVLEAIGAIKRVRFNDAKGRKGGFFLYYGRDAAIRRLRSIRKESFQIASELKLACQKSPSTQDIDISTIEYFEDQAEAEKWPSLTTTTICFLGLLLQRDHKNAIPVPSISHRMIEAKQALELITDGDISNAHVDVNRRVYDVVSVLASCNVLLMSVTANSHGLQYDEIDKISLRKHVRFNHEIFTDHSSLKIANVTLNQLAEMNQDRHKSTGPRTRLREKQPQEDENEIARISEAESLLTLKSSSGGIAFQSLTTLASPAEEESKIKLPTTPTGRSGVASENVVDPDITQFEPLFWNLKPCGLEDLFSPLHYECENDWYQDFLHDIIFHDCLSSQYRMHWEMLSSLDQDTNYVWGADATAASSLIRPDYTDHELATIDLECHEILDEVLDEDYLL